jgi:hypothetical protein
MKLLLVCNHPSHIQETLKFIGYHPTKHQETIIFNHLEIDVLVTGFGGFQTTFHLTELLAKKQFHLILKTSTAVSFQSTLAIGQVLNVVRDFPASDGEIFNDSFKDLYELQLLNVNDPPHQLGGLVNKTNSYMNVFIPYKKVFGITSTISSKNSRLLKMRNEKYHPHIETRDGIFFSYPCLWKKLNYYHLAVVAENLMNEEENVTLAIQALNKEIKEIIQKL